MKFNISAFTHVGTVRESNQDNILVNGQLLNEGEVHLIDQDNCICFVADGVGGNKAGEFASHFILEKLKSVPDFSFSNVEQTLHEINEQLIKESKSNEKIKGTATTLTGLVIRENIFQIIHAGDSQIWLLRNDMFFKITSDQVLDESETNSPITSYFGGMESNLKLDTNFSIHETLTDDIFLICSDGLLKSLNQKIIKSILKADKDLETKSKKILENCLQAGAEDNTSIILIQQTN
jgi:protein phosphatase